jgi:polyisoprenoid-binding protein YceI
VDVSVFRGSFSEIDATLTTTNGRASFDGEVHVESISIGDPQEMRDHIVWGTDFFNAGTHPTIGFRSTSVEFQDDGWARVTGDLTIVRVRVPIAAMGTYRGPTEDPFGGCRVGVDLGVTVDRRQWGMNWQMPLPGGGDALGWEVEISAQLELVRQG